MGAARRALVILFALSVAIGTALIALTIAAGLDPELRRAGAAFLNYVFYLLAQGDFDKTAALSAAALARFVWTAIVAVCVAPLVIVAAIGEAAGARSPLWYVGATGVLAATAPWAARAVFGSARVVSASPQELRFAAVFFLTGAVAGFAYWLLAGRGTRDPHGISNRTRQGGKA